MSLATGGFDDLRKILGERHGPSTGNFARQDTATQNAVVKDAAGQRADQIDRSLAELSRTPTLIAVVWLTFYILIAFAAWAH